MKVINATTRPSGKIHYYKDPEEVPSAMSKLIKDTNSRLRSENTHPLIIATEFHYRFLNDIHPFGDGNGRIARIFMNLILLKNEFPPIFIKNIDKLSYMNSFEDEDKNPGTMVNFMAERLIESLKTKLAYLKRLQ